MVFVPIAECPQFEISRAGIVRKQCDHEVINPLKGLPAKICLYIKTNTYIRMLLHRVVATTFIPNPNRYNHIHFRDRNLANYSASNLVWGRCLPANKPIFASKPRNGIPLLRFDDCVFDRVPYQITPDGTVWSEKEMCFILPDVAGRVILRCNPNRTIKKFKMSLLVASLFCARPSDPSGTWTIKHIDGNPNNNRCTNLQWMGIE